MSDHVSMNEAHLVVPGAKADGALEVLIEDVLDLPGEEHGDLEEVMSELGFRVTLDRHDGIAALVSAEAWANYDALPALGPYVERGCFVKVTPLGDAEPFFYVFTGRRCHTVSAADVTSAPAGDRFDLPRLDELEQ